MSQYSISASWVINIIGLRQVAGANISDPFKVIAPVSVFDTVANSKEHFRASISLSGGGNVQYITTNSSLTGPLGTAVAWSFVQMIAIRNTSNVETGGTLRVTFADAELGTTLCTLTLGAEGVVTAFTLSDHGKFSRSAK